MSLEDELKQYRRQIATDAYPMSIGELANLYRDGEMDIHPEFQRIFRWTPSQKTRLVESILLGIPLPSLFVASNEEGVWDVVDGVQRLSTIFQFMGILRGEEGELLDPFVCGEAPFLKSLAGVSYDGKSNDLYTLDSTQRLDFKRARIDVKIIKRQSDNRAKYDLFQRLNSYGSVATDQELRNCLLVSMSKSHYEWLVSISKDEDFLSVLEMQDRLLNERYHMELAMRFVTLRKIELSRLSKIGNIGEFLTAEVVPFVAKSEMELREEEEVFRKTFRLLRGAGGPEMLRKWNPVAERTEGPFSLSAFEAIALGIGFRDADASITPELVAAKRVELWSMPQYAAGFSTGKRADERMRKTIPTGRELFA
ncbi:hypothetical protein GAR05_05165 [Micromonospora saelicesensis]|uniref:GmrSD restriction endonucleases N-terminal domain-containing protein n=1 Tax=Micromonospora saelicesensis TaxID=285676 RepID=A0ABX9CC54_9ACTN|nr:DUF262 domain-containing protein [Micromonospora saelicesensis]RAN93865.1 hypothetical protein GAR05_05165 [Micromonospora saelicesensis]